MIPARIHTAILRTASLLVPEPLRADWRAEWRSELWHIRRDPGTANVTAFCMGAFRDAFWLRRNASGARRAGILRLDAPATPEGIDGFPDAGVPALSRPSRGLWFLTALAALSIAISFLIPAARAVLLGLVAPRNAVVLGPADQGFAAPWPSVSRKQFEALKVRSGSQFTRIEFRASKQAKLGVVTGYLRDGTLHDARFRFTRVRDQSLQLLSILTTVLPFAGLLALFFEPTSQRPAWPGYRKVLFLIGKLGLTLPILVFGSLDLASLSGAVSPACINIAFLGGIFAVRWILADQHQRCPVCLRLLTNPVRMGEASHILLEWHGTELMCTLGHGLLYVPEWPALWSPRQRWIDLGASWAGLFRQ